MQYLPTIGLEVHVQLKTRRKMFCNARWNSAPIPTRTPAPSAGISRRVAGDESRGAQHDRAHRADAWLRVPEICKFDRKNYFYPDMPKNYQITQYDSRFASVAGCRCTSWRIRRTPRRHIAPPDKAVRLARIHLEEDVAKSFHFETTTGIDFNRAGTPLMEIVSEPDIDSPEEAFAYLTSLQQILVYGEVSDADMEKGQLRCDCNVSVRPEAQEE